MIETQGKRMGRPPKADGDRRDNVSFRLKGSVRAKLTDAAEASSHSLSEEIERRLESSFDQEREARRVAAAADAAARHATKATIDAVMKDLLGVSGGIDPLIAASTVARAIVEAHNAMVKVHGLNWRDDADNQIRALAAIGPTVVSAMDRLRGLGIIEADPIVNGRVVTDRPAPPHQGAIDDQLIALSAQEPSRSIVEGSNDDQVIATAKPLGSGRRSRVLNFRSSKKS